MAEWREVAAVRCEETDSCWRRAARGTVDDLDLEAVGRRRERLDRDPAARPPPPFGWKLRGRDVRGADRQGRVRRDREIDHHACRRIAVPTGCPPADDPVAGVMALAAAGPRRGPTAEDLAQVHVKLGVVRVCGLDAERPAWLDRQR